MRSIRKINGRKHFPATARLPALGCSLAALLMASVAYAADGNRVRAVGEPNATLQIASPAPELLAQATPPGVQYPPGYEPAGGAPTPPKVDLPKVEPVTPATPVATPAVPATPAATPVAEPAVPAATPPVASAPVPEEPIPPIVEGAPVTARKYTIQYNGVDPKVLAELRGGLSTDVLLNVPLTLTIVNGEVVGKAPVPSTSTSQPAATTVTTTLADLGGIKAKMRPEAIAMVESQLVEYLHGRGLYGVWIAPDKRAYSAATTPEGVAELPLIVHVVKVTSVASGATGKAITDDSPIQPAGKTPESGLLLKDDLDDYLLRLNRVPSRRVDVAVAANIPSDKPSGIEGLALSYLVTQQKPWEIFAQVSNTGTKQTNVWRERFGFVDNQLTGHNDILTLDFTTAGFDDTSNSISASYEIPVSQESNPTRLRVFTSYGNFVASDVGLAALMFRGDSTMVGGEIIQPLLQVHELFLDGVVGFRYEHQRVANEGISKGTGDFSQPYLGLRMERSTPESSLAGGAELIGTITSSSQQSLDSLGRLGADRDSVVLQGHVSYSFYLEPILDAANYRTQKSTLAHEIYIAGRAQESFDYRLAPSMEDTIGGLYSVRGYPESVSAGDSIVVGTAEYRLHIPRLFAVGAPGKDMFGQPFRYAPQQPYGRPDWDLVAKAFVDVGQTYLNNKIAGEGNQSLVGTGLGVEFLYKQYLSIRADWGVAIQPINDESSGENVKGGSNRFHLVFTLSY